MVPKLRDSANAHQYTPAHIANPWLSKLNPVTTTINKMISSNGRKGLRSTELTPRLRKASTLA